MSKPPTPERAGWLERHLQNTILENYSVKKGVRDRRAGPGKGWKMLNKLLCRLLGHRWKKTREYIRRCERCKREEALWLNNYPSIGEARYFWDASPSQRMDEIKSKLPWTAWPNLKGIYGIYWIPRNTCNPLLSGNWCAYRRKYEDTNRWWNLETSWPVSPSTSNWRKARDTER